MDSFDPALSNLTGLAADPPIPNHPIDQRPYVTTLLECYVQLPHTPNRPSGYDRRLAASLFNQKVTLDIVKAAFVLATSRRTFRPKNAPPLQPIRSLAYFLPVIEELQRTTPDPFYINLLKQRLHTGSSGLGVPPLDPPIPW
jgi:hypothetical protein